MRVVLIIGIAVALLIGSFFALNQYIYRQKQGTGAVPEPYRATLSGEYVCLPHRDTTGPQTLECAFGIRLDDGTYYAIDMQLMSQEAATPSVGDRITATGLVTPVERLSTDHWRQYPIVGIFSVTDSLRVNWQTARDSVSGVSFQYPTELSTQFIHTLDWPPKVQILRESFSCIEAGNETARAGRTERRMVGEREYCVTRVTEGAAGSIYTQHAYAFSKDGMVAILTFSTRAVQCGNYDDPQRTECERERETFDLDGVIDRIAATLQINPTVN